MRRKPLSVFEVMLVAFEVMCFHETLLNKRNDPATLCGCVRISTPVEAETFSGINMCNVIKRI